MMGERIRVNGVLALILGAMLLAGCARDAAPEAVAIEYARAVYAGDPGRAYRLIAAEDRRVKDERTFLHEREAVSGFTLEAARQLASFISATTREKTLEGTRAKVTLALRLPNANAPEIAALVHDWDERRLNALSEAERRGISRKLDELHRAGAIPLLEGEETFELVREDSGWRILLAWAKGVRVRFEVATAPALPLEVAIAPREAVVSPGERFTVTVSARNRAARDVVVRAGHRAEPKPAADSLALLQCPLFLPVTLGPGETETFRSVYLLLKDVPPQAKELRVTYEFLPVASDQGGKPRVR
jgi:hypothetical protein